MSTKPYRVYTDEELASMVGRLLTKEEKDALMAEALERWPDVEARSRLHCALAEASQREREASRIARGLPPISDDELAFDAKCEEEWRATWSKYEQKGWRRPTEAESREILDEIERDIQREEARGAFSRFVHRCRALGRAYYLRTTFPLRWWWRQRHQ